MSKLSNHEPLPAGVPARILVVDDHPLVRAGLAQLIRQQPGLICCGQADTAAAALAAVPTLQPHLVTVDLRLKGGDGLNLIKDLKLQYPSLLTLVISQSDEMVFAERVLKLGARGYLMKERATEEVLAAIHALLAGKIYLSSAVAAFALGRPGRTGPDAADRPLGNLSSRELQVFQLLGAGLNNRKIAQHLGVSIKTIEAHRENLKVKLGITNAPQLLRYATEQVNGPGSLPRSSDPPPSSNLPP
jgi:DNA-binding NarL/FixJ family response regulator